MNVYMKDYRNLMIRHDLPKETQSTQITVMKLLCNNCETS